MERIRYRKSGLDYNEINNQCCYSCTYCIKPDSDGRGVCSLDNSKQYIYFKNYCTRYDDAGLILCAECNKWFRSLTRHVHVHGMTIDEYKEANGYNRTTGLVSDATSARHSKYASEHDLLGEAKGKNIEGSKGHTWKLRDEGMMSFERNYEERGGYEFMSKMVRRAAEVMEGIPKTPEHRTKMSQAKLGIKQGKRQIRKRINSLKRFYSTHEKIILRKDNGQILTSYNIERE